MARLNEICLKEIKDDGIKSVMQLLQHMSWHKFNWILERIKKVKCVRHKEIEEHSDIGLEHFLSSFKVIPKQCFLTAWKTCSRLDNVKYVEGYMIQKSIRIPIHHAWNLCNGEYFDLTNEIIFDRIESTTYYPIFSLGKFGLFSYSALQGNYGPYLGLHYKKLGLGTL
jgi:hypothetical protein